jgi:choline dehydrogenase
MTHASDAAGKLAEKSLHCAQSRSQASIGLLLRVGFESVEALTRDAQSPLSAAYFHLHVVGGSLGQTRTGQCAIGEHCANDCAFIVSRTVAAQCEDLLDFRMEQVAPEVEEMNADLDQRSSAIHSAALPVGNPEIGARAVPYGVDRFNDAERAALNVFTRAADQPMPAHVEAHQDPHVVPARELDHLVGMNHFESDRLFDEDMAARLDHRRRDFEVRGGRNQHADHVGRARPNQRRWIGEDVLDFIARSHASRLPFVHVGERGHSGALDFAKRGHVLELADFAASDQADPKCFFSHDGELSMISSRTRRHKCSRHATRDIQRGMNESDYIVVGGGTAGCVVAARLVARGCSVTLLEAGGAYSRILDVPLVGLWAWLRRPQRYCWDHWTVPQSSLGGRSVWFPAGRIVGGSSAINAMIYCRGDRRSYDRWNLAGWSYADLLPYFRRAEDYEGGASEYHGAGGPIGVAPGRFVHALGRGFLEGCASLGIPLNQDFSGASGEGVGFYHLTQHNGRRSSTANSYLTGARPKLRLVVGAHVSKVLIEGKRAVGIEYLHERRVHTARAGREVILCAGTVKSPQILQLSGIGPAENLRRLGISVVVDLPGVGANLQDHVRVPMVFRVARPRYTSLPALVTAGPRYVLRRRGLLASNVADAAAIVRTTESAEVPDVRVVFKWRDMPELPGTFVAFETGLIDPHSRGCVGLASADPLKKPRIDPNYLMDASDRSRMEIGLGLARRIAQTSGCREAGIGAEFLPADRLLAEHIEAHASSSFHPVGTCRMGTDEMAVVDRELRVRGVVGLRVVDASIMPTTVSGNAQAAVFAIAERATDLISPLGA